MLYSILQEDLRSHARLELEKAGLFSKDSDYNGMIGNAVMELIEQFAKQGHSGFSAAWVKELFNKLADYNNLTPLSDNTDEWNLVAEDIWQNVRNPAVFSKDGGKTMYHVDGKTIKNGIVEGVKKYMKKKEIKNKFSLLQLTEEIEKPEQEQPKPVDKNFLVQVQEYNKLGEQIYRKNSLRELVKILNYIGENASTHMVQETDDWFDKITVGRHAKELKAKCGQAEKVIKELHQSQMRLETLYEEIGGILNRYYKIDDKSETPVREANKITTVVAKVKQPNYEGTIKLINGNYFLYDSNDKKEEAGPFNSVKSLMSYFDIQQNHIVKP